MEVLDGLDKAYNDLGRVCDGGSLEGFTPTLEGVGDTLTSEERDFARWQETLGESAKRFTAATSTYLKENGGGGAVGQFYADNQLIQFCDYAVQNWDHIDKAAEVIKQREAALLMQGKMRDLDSNAAALGVQYVTPVKRVDSKVVVHGISGLYAGDFADSLERAVEMDRLGVPTGVGEIDNSFIDEMSDEDTLATAGALGMVTLDEDGIVTIDLGCLGVPSAQEVIRIPRYVIDTYSYVGMEGLDGRRWNKFKAWFRRGAQKIKSGFKRAGQAVKRAVKKAASKIKQGVKKVAAKVKQAARYVADKTKGAFQAVGHALKKAVTFVKNGVTYIWDKTKGLMKKVGNAIVRVAKAVGKALKTLGQKIAAAFKKWAKRLNPKNIISRLVILRRVRKGKYGIATGAYYGMIGAAESAKLGVVGERFKESKEAYDRLLQKWNELGGRESALRNAINQGRSKFDGKMPSKSEIAKDVANESKDMNAKQLEAQEKEAVKREEGLKGGLGSITAALITLITTIISSIMALVMSIIKFLQQKKARKEQEKQAEAAMKEQGELVKEKNAEAQAKSALAAKKEKELAKLQQQQAAARSQGIIKQKASMTRVAVMGALAVGALVVISVLKNGGK